MIAKVKVKDVPAVRDAVGRLARERLPMQTVLKVLRIGRQLDAEISAVAETQQRIDDRYVLLRDGKPVPAEGGGGYRVNDPIAYAAELTDLYNATVEVPALPLSELGLNWQGEEGSDLASALLGLGAVLVDDAADAPDKDEPLNQVGTDGN